MEENIENSKALNLLCKKMKKPLLIGFHEWTVVLIGSGMDESASFIRPVSNPEHDLMKRLA